jgi:hypothetical protein
MKKLLAALLIRSRYGLVLHYPMYFYAYEGGGCRERYQLGAKNRHH